MNLNDAIDDVKSKFEFHADLPQLVVDYWMVMKDIDGIFYGDCDDYVLTVLWNRCNRNIFSFILNVLILHRFRIYFTITKFGQGHVVGYADGLYFDNWSNEALPKDKLIEQTGHSIKFFWPSVYMIFPMFFGLFMRYIVIK